MRKGGDLGMGKEGVRSGEKGSEGEGGERRRRIETKGKAKVVVSVWGAEIVQFLAALAILPRSISKKRLNSAGLFEKTVEFNRFFQNDRNKTASTAGNLNKFYPPNRRNDLCLAFCFNPSSKEGRMHGKRQEKLVKEEEKEGKEEDKDERGKEKTRREKRKEG